MNELRPDVAGFPFIVPPVFINVLSAAPYERANSSASVSVRYVEKMGAVWVGWGYGAGGRMSGWGECVPYSLTCSDRDGLGAVCCCDWCLGDDGHQGMACQD